LFLFLKNLVVSALLSFPLVLLTPCRACRCGFLEDFVGVCNGFDAITENAVGISDAAGISKLNCVQESCVSRHENYLRQEVRLLRQVLQIRGLTHPDVIQQLKAVPQRSKRGESQEEILSLAFEVFLVLGVEALLLKREKLYYYWLSRSEERRV